MMNKPELLAPAGDFEKLKAAVAYGADAVYMAGSALGLRANAGNFDTAGLRKGIEYAHAKNVKVYITANIYAHNADFGGMAEYFRILADFGADALIISDPGVFMTAREAVPDIPIHISTQANTTNRKSAEFWNKLGAERVVLARELSLAEIKETAEAVPNMTLECFVHGAMCVSYSGRCLLSSYMTGRDSNRGDCAQPCRYKYFLTEETRPGEHMPVFEDERGTYIFNSRDLCMIGHLDDIICAGVNSLKIEGRMKSPYYVATTVGIYREAIDDYFANPKLYENNKEYYLEQLKKASHRGFTTGFYYGKPGGEAQNCETSAYIRGYSFIGLVLGYDEASGFATVEQRNKFSLGDEVEFFRSNGESFTQTISEMYDSDGNAVQDAPHAQQILRTKVARPVAEMDMLRKKA